MRKSMFHPPIIFFIAWLFVVASCDKYDQPEITPPGSIPNTAPKSLADEDIFVFSPDNSVILQGSAEDNEHDKISFEWKKIKGAASSPIENSNIFKAKVSNLDIGEYEFELTAADARGLAGKDTVKVIVLAKPSNEFVSNQLKGECPFGCSYTVKIDIPLPSVYRVFVQYSDKPTNWFETFDGTKPPSATGDIFWMSGGELLIFSYNEYVQSVRIIY